MFNDVIVTVFELMNVLRQSNSPILGTYILQIIIYIILIYKYIIISQIGK